MEKIKSFLKKKNIVISGKRYGIDALGAMAQGLFASLLIGTIISTIGEQAVIELLVTIGGYAKAASGPAMAIALLTTFYGCIEANVIFNPIANKLKLRHDEEMLCKSIICEGVYAIQAGENPRFIEEKLLLMLEKAETKKFGGGAESKE